MDLAFQKPWTVERFLAWAEAQDHRYEFDGTRPVPMTGGSARHNRIAQNLYAALRTRLRESGCAFYGPDLGMQTVGGRVRYPDALITCTRFDESERLAPDVVVVFEVTSPGSGSVDRVQKLREYGAVPSVLRYVVIESTSPGLLDLHRANGAEPWTARGLDMEDMLALTEIGIEIPVADLYEEVSFGDGPAPASSS